MKKLFSTNYSDSVFNVTMLVLRTGLGLLIIPRGYQKLIHFSERKDKFINFLGMGSTVSLSLVVFAEVVCAGLLILGLFTRFAALALVILTAVIVFKVEKGDLFGRAELAMLYLLGYFAVMMLGPGKYSVDAKMGK